MKGIKKLLTGIFAATLAMTMNVTALAAGGTIKVENTENGTTYNFYRILDIKGVDTNKDTTLDVVSYTINSDWTNFFTGNGAGASYIVDDDVVSADGKHLSPINVNGATKYINLTESNIVEFTNKATKYAIESDKSKEASTTGDGNTVSVAVNDLGYYIMVPEGASIQNENSHGSIASITSTVPNATMKVKATKPTIEKEDDVEDAEIGQTVNYTIKGKVPNTAGYTEYTYIITDTMTSGLTFQNDVVVKIGTTDITKDKDVVVSNGTTDNDGNTTFTVNIPVINYQANVGADIIVSYTAKVNEKAVVKLQEKNKVKLTYGHTPEDTEEYEEELYSSKVIINKTDDNSTPLADAKFVLMNSKGEFYAYDATEKAVSWAKVTDVAIADDKTIVTDAMAEKLAAAAKAGTITEQVTDAKGAAEFIGLKNGAYYLVEYKAPEGYNRLSNPEKVTVQGTNVDTKELENKAQAGQTDFDSNDIETATVTNHSGVKLPETGGIGTTIFYIVGGILIVAGVAYFILRRKSAAE